MRDYRGWRLIADVGFAVEGVSCFGNVVGVRRRRDVSCEASFVYDSDVRSG